MSQFIYAAIGSVTTATRLSRELKRHGVRNAVVHTPTQINTGGCSYSVKIEPINKEILDKITEQKGYKIKKTYASDGEGNYYVIS